MLQLDVVAVKKQSPMKRHRSLSDDDEKYWSWGFNKLVDVAVNTDPIVVTTEKEQISVEKSVIMMGSGF
jgi:4-diphosphocytidyl-2C-methyl-D-erythritol kinase